MASVRDILDDFVNKAGNAILSPLPPDRDTLGGFNPDFRELKRDDLGIIMMPQQSCGEISPDLDGGDSAHREGVAAFCNSEPDKKLLDLFVNNSGVMVRHPNQVPWNEPDNSSADQLRGFMVGCWRAGRSDLAQRLLVAHEARNWHCQNIMAPERCPKLVRKNPKPPDVLAPQEVMGLRIAAGMNEAYLDLLGQFCLYVAIQIASNDFEEDNGNLLKLSIVCGRLDIFVSLHKNWEDSVKQYWRFQVPMGEAVIAIVKKELERYPPDRGIQLLPVNLLKFLQTHDAYTELINFDPKHRVELGSRFGTAVAKDTLNFFVNVRRLSVSEALTRLKTFLPSQQSPEAIAHQLAKAMQDSGIKIPADVARNGLAAAGVPRDLIDRFVPSDAPDPIRDLPLPRPHPALPQLPPHPNLPKKWW